MNTNKMETQNIKHKIILKIILITSILILLMITISAINAATTTITNTTAGGLGGAITNAASGDTINLSAGTYKNNVPNLVIRKNITIVGRTSQNTIIDVQKMEECSPFLKHQHLH